MRPSRILYAEDDENDVFFMERALARLGGAGELHVVHNGRQVLKFLTGMERDGGERSRPGLIILDIKMPEMSGLEVLAWLRAKDEFAAVPVVIFTSSTQEKDIEFCRRHHANAYIVKPANAEHLAGLVERMIAAAASGAGGRFDLPENQL